MFSLNKTIKNAFIFLITNKNKVLLVQEINGKWGLPGGMLNIGENPFNCMLREFKEETTFDLPQLYNYNKFDYHNHSRIYYNKTDVKFNKFEPKFVLNNEIKDLKYFKLNDLFNYDGLNITINLNIILRKEFIKSLNEMIIEKSFKSFIIPYLSIKKNNIDKYSKYKSKYLKLKNNMI